MKERADCETQSQPAAEWPSARSSSQPAETMTFSVGGRPVAGGRTYGGCETSERSPSAAAIGSSTT
eukprot:6390656-Prymnesium_polylepis.1